MASKIGYVKSIEGAVKVIGADGIEKAVVAGEAIYENDVVITGVSSNAVLSLENGHTVEVGADEELSLDSSVSAAVTPDDAVLDDVAALQAALLAGEELDPTAAGAGVTGGTTSGLSDGAVYDERTDDRGDVAAGQTPDAWARSFPESELEVVAADEEIEPEETTASVDEGGLAASATVAADGTDHPSDSDLVIDGALTLQPGVTVETAQSGTATFGTWSVDTNGTFDYTLTHNTADAPLTDETDSFSYTAQDAVGNTVTNTVTISIVDDVPIADPDEGTVDEGATLTVDADNGVLADDTSGADAWIATGAGVVGVAAGDTGTELDGTGVSTGIAGTYGTLTLAADGSYEYVADANTLPDDEQNPQDVFTYTVKDGDGDLTHTTLTIDVNDVTIEPEETTASVDEGGLAASATVAADGTDHPSDSDLVIDGALTLQPGVTVETAQSGTATFGTWSVDTNGTFDYTLTHNTADAPLTDETDSFSYTAQDAVGNTVTNTVTISIVDDVPIADPDEGTVDEGATLTVDADNGVLADDTSGADAWIATGAGVVGVAAGDTGTELDGTGVSTGIAGTYGTLTLAADGSYEYVADANTLPDDEQNPQDVFTYTVKDGDGDLTHTTLTIDVNDVTIEPEETTASVDEGGLAASATVAADGTDHPSDSDLVIDGALTLQPGVTVETAQSGTATFGTWSVDTNGTFDYTLTHNTADAPLTDETDSFSYTAQDAVGNTVTNTVTISIVDDVPIADPDEGTVDEGATLTVDADNGVLADDTSGADAWIATGAGVVGVAAGDTGTELDGTGVSTGIAGTYGTLTLAADGSYEYVADANTLPDDEQNPQDVFTYTVKDGDGDLTHTTLTIDVNDVTIEPEETTASVDEGGLAASATVAADGTDHPSDSDLVIDGALTLQPGVTVETAQSGTATFGTWSVDTNGTFDYTLTHNTADAPLTDETDSFSYTAQDAVGNTVTNTVTISIVDDVPIADPDEGTVDEGATLTVDADNGVLADDTSGADAWIATGAGVVGVAAGDTGTELDGTGVSTGIAGTYGTLTLAADGSYEYVADANTLPDDEQNPQDVFTYTVKDGDGDLTHTTLTIDVNDVTIEPEETTASVDEGGLAASATVAADGTDHPSDSDLVIDGALTLQPGVTVETAQSGTATFGTWSVDTNGTFDYTLTHNTADAPLTDETDSFSYTAQDAVGNTVTNTVTISIVDDVPIADPDEGTVDEGATLTVDADNGVLADDTSGADAWIATGAGVVGVAAGDTGTELDGTGVSTGIAGTYGTLTLAADGSYEYVADANTLPDDEQNPQDVFTYTVKDGDGDLTHTTLTIDVNDVTLEPDHDDVQVDEAALNDVGTNPTSDAETVTGILDVTGAVSYVLNGTGAGTYGDLTIINSATGEYSYTLTSPMDSGAITGTNVVNDVETFSYTAMDINGNTVDGIITVDIVDDVPKVTDDAQNVVMSVDADLATASLGIDVGADDGSVVNTDPYVVFGVETGQVVTDTGGTTLTSDGNELEYLVNSDGSVEAGYYDPADPTSFVEVFTLTGNALDGTYTVDNNVDHSIDNTISEITYDLNDSFKNGNFDSYSVIVDDIKLTVTSDVGTVNISGQGSGVSDQSIESGETLFLTFEYIDENGDVDPNRTVDLTSLSFIADHLGTAEIGNYTLVKDASVINGETIGGTVVADGTFTGIANNNTGGNASDDHVISIDSSGISVDHEGNVITDEDSNTDNIVETNELTDSESFNSIQLTSTSGGYRIEGGDSVTVTLVDPEVTLDMSAIIVDADGDESEAQDFDITFVTGNTLTGSDDADVIVGSDADETIDGKGGDDIIDAGAGNDTIDGGAGADYIDGGDGIDTVINDDGLDTIVDADIG